MSIQSDRSTIRQAPHRAQAIAFTYKARLAELQRERRYNTPAWYDRELSRAKSDLAFATTQLHAQCEAARERLEAQRDYARGASSRSQDAARVMNTQAAWRNILGVLSRQSSLPEQVARAKELVEQAARRGDVAVLRALRENLPWWAEATEPADVRARREAAGRSFDVAETTFGALLPDIVKLGAPHFSPEERLADELDADLVPFNWAVSGNVSRLELLAEDPGSPAVAAGMLGWEKGEIVPIDGVVASSPTIAYRRSSSDE